uniref:StAR related lipid transfer domain containing 5 n=1 Tax=Cynoglossus semilaevis TaxID=244447 RepID=A0A3P8V4Q1_CYNSE
MDYEHEAKKATDSMQSYRTDTSGWKVCKKSNDVVVSWQTFFSSFACLFPIIKCLPYKEIGLFTLSSSLTELYVENILLSPTQGTSICRTVTPSAAMGIIAPRDFVDVVVVKQYGDGSISSNATNVTHVSCPPQPGYVRGFNHPCGCICVPVSGEPNKTQVYTFFQTDLGGLLPRSVVDSFFPSSMAEFYNNLAKSVKSHKDI